LLFAHTSIVGVTQYIIARSVLYERCRWVHLYSDVRKQKDTMSKQTTALLTVGPRSIAPWGDRAWRITLTAQLVSANSGDYWIVTPTEPANHVVVPSEVLVEVPQQESLIESVIMLLAAHLGDEDVEACLLETHNIDTSVSVRTIPAYWDISDGRTFEYLTGRLSQMVRLGITVLDDMSLVTPDVVGDLRLLGFDVDVFVPALVVNG
jgi:hypothetical protein